MSRFRLVRLMPDPGRETFVQAAADMAAPEHLKRAVLYERRQRTDTRGAHPDILRFASRFCDAMAARGVPVLPMEMMRSEARQNALAAAGRSRARFGQSPHNFGLAVDLVVFPHMWDVPGHWWPILGLVGKDVARRLKLKVAWGGDWKFYDPAHWELADWRSLTAWADGSELSARAVRPG